MLAMNALISFSKLPLKFATYLGLISGISAIVMAFLVLYWRVFQTNSPVKGYATILIIVFFIGAIQLISVGILGEYIGRIYEEVKGRPLYTLKETGGFAEKKAGVYREFPRKKIIQSLQ
jgi:dolichol-phosphate mannosyltransferase